MTLRQLQREMDAEEYVLQLAYDELDAFDRKQAADKAEMRARVRRR